MNSSLLAVVKFLVVFPSVATIGCSYPYTSKIWFIYAVSLKQEEFTPYNF